MLQILTRKQKEQEPIPLPSLWKWTKKLHWNEAGSTGVEGCHNRSSQEHQGQQM